MAGYTYRGDQPAGIDHGTNKGYYQHRRKGLLPVCDPCRIAHNETNNENSRRRKGAKRWHSWPAKCGTDGGYTSHRNKGETPCIACKVAHSDAALANYHRRREGVTPKRAANDTRHGTPGGYRKHVRLRTIPCEPCRIAHNEASAAYRARRKEAS